MIEVKNETEPVVTKIIIELSGDDVSHFAYMLSDYRAFLKDKRRPWPWLDRLIENVGKAR